jgi:3-O-methylgallate 3,4-dioxygenase
MAKIVLGMGTSHGPMLSTPPEGWGLRVPFDKRVKHHYKGRLWSFDELTEQRKAENLAAQLTPEVWARRHADCRKAISRLAQVFEEAKPDVAVIVGNDQMEIFKEDLIPAFSVMMGDTIINNMYSAERLAALPEGVAVSVPGHIPEQGASYQGVPALGKHLIESLTAGGFDVTALKKLHPVETPHAFGFVYRQIMRDRVIPNVPVLVNTFYPPNQPPLRRCHAFGKSLLAAIQSWDSDLRVALMCSGGLSHFVIDEELDQTALAAMRGKNIDGLAALPESYFQAGSSEIKNWVPVASAMAELPLAMTTVDYIPCYRSEAGTGNAMAFVYWQ